MKCHSGPVSFILSPIIISWVKYSDIHPVDDCFTIVPIMHCSCINVLVVPILYAFFIHLPSG